MKYPCGNCGSATKIGTEVKSLSVIEKIETPNKKCNEMSREEATQDYIPSAAKMNENIGMIKWSQFFYDLNIKLVNYG